MSKPCCKNCVHFQNDVGECWANPPLAQMGMRINPLTGKAEEAKFTYFPAPNRQFIEKIVCGSYSPRLEVVQ